MRIVFVMGPACAGKSTFIKKHFPDFYKVDLFDFQTDFMSVDMVMKSYEDCKNALIDAIKTHENIVLEHTLLKAIRRKVYIDAVKEITDIPIEAYFIYPSDEELKENSLKRKIKVDTWTLKNYRETAEVPTKNEGFVSVMLITNNEN
jgi:predicted kinase